MHITVRSRNGVYRQVNVESDVEAQLAAAQTEQDRRRMRRELEALALFQNGFSYGEIAKALDIGKSTAYRRVQDAQRRLGVPVPNSGFQPCR
jgi:DNA-binding NarL/FixJ family response regulator